MYTCKRCEPLRMFVMLTMVIIQVCVTAMLPSLLSCSPSNTKISASPKKIAIDPESTILVCPVSGLPENDSEMLIKQASKEIKKHLPEIVVPDYWDIEFKARQAAIRLPGGKSYDSTTVQLLRTKLSIDFILLSQADKFSENDDGELSNPRYQTREAIISMQLLDLKTRKIIWHSTTRVFANPLKVNGSTQHYSINILSGSFAINKAYNESIKKLEKAIILVQE